MTQLAFDLAERRAAEAADHANQVHDDWTEKALAAFRAHAEKHSEFSTEDVIAASPDVPTAPDKRAWGYIAKAAVKAGICFSVGIGRSKLAHAHGRWITTWRSKVFTPQAAAA